MMQNDKGKEKYRKYFQMEYKNAQTEKIKNWSKKHSKI